MPSRHSLPRPSWAFLAGMAAGILGLAIVALHIFADDEDALFDRIVAEKTASDWTDQRKLAVLTNVAHTLVKNRADIFAGRGRPGFRERWLRSADVDLLTGSGACGSYTSVLARLLDRAGIPFRISQMYCAEGGWGCHITVDAKVEGKWVAADALYDVVYPVDGETVGENWDQYRYLLPDDYDPRYRYADIRYTNWTKIPLVMPAAKRILDRVAPGFAKTLSLRSYVLNIYRTYEVALIFLALCCGLLALLRIRKRGSQKLWAHERAASGINPGS